MRIARFTGLMLTGLLILFYSCNRNIVSLAYTNAKEEVPQLAIGAAGAQGLVRLCN